MSEDGKIVLLLKADGTQETLRLTEHPSLKQMQEWVGGYIERVRIKYMGRPCDMLVDEEGLLKGKPLNEKATRFYMSASGCPIVGDVATFTNFDLE